MAEDEDYDDDETDISKSDVFLLNLTSCVYGGELFEHQHVESNENNERNDSMDDEVEVGQVILYV